MKNKINPALRWLKRLPKQYWPQWMRNRLLKGVIEVAVWHRNEPEAAKVVGDYAKSVLEHAWGDKYEIRVWQAQDEIPEGMGRSEAMGHIRDNVKQEYGYKAKDVNLLCFSEADATGGGSVCKFTVDNPDFPRFNVTAADVEDLKGKKPKKYATGKPYGLISAGVHEMGHCLGLGHDLGGKRSHNGQKWVTPMPYIEGDDYYLRFSEEAIQKGPTVQ